MSERLTYRSKSGKLYTFGRDYDNRLVKATGNSSCTVVTIEALNKLAAYEEAEESGELVKVVRCKDCEHNDQSECPMRMNIPFDEDDFCNYGERKEK
jgi:hypothetical protein